MMTFVVLIWIVLYNHESGLAGILLQCEMFLGGTRI